MNNTPTFQVVNPLAETIRESEEVIYMIQEASDNLNEAIRLEREAYGRYNDAKETYEMAEYDELSEVVMLAQQKDGPLAGIAVSGKGYEIALTKLKNDLKRGKLQQAYVDLDRYRRAYEIAKTDLEQTQTRFNALRKICDVKAMVLRASTI